MVLHGLVCSGMVGYRMVICNPPSGTRCRRSYLGPAAARVSNGDGGRAAMGATTHGVGPEGVYNPLNSNLCWGILHELFFMKVDQ